MLLAAATLAAVAAATYQLLRTTLLDDIERDVARRAAEFRASPPQPPIALDVFSAPDVFLQVVDPNGDTIASSGNLGARKLPLPTAVLRGEVVEVHVEDRPLFEAAAGLPDGSTIVVARSPMTTYGALRELRRLLVIVGSIALAVTGTLGWLYAGGALRPINRLIEAAQDVRMSRDLSRRVPRQGPPDEVGQLATTFNAMLVELEDAYRSLDRSNQRLRQFLADCAHELRAPLTLLMSNLDVLAKAGEGDPQFRNQALSDIRLEAERMARMVTQLLILARADAGATLEFEPVPLAHLVQETCRTEGRASNGVRFVVDGVHGLDGVSVNGSSDHLRQALLILLDNAFKYTPAGGEVRVEAGVEGPVARVSVTDSGSGIDEDDLPRIFERFYRGRNAEAVTGTGLGLAIARWVAEQHGGRIEVSTIPGTGSRFSLMLPVNESVLSYDGRAT
jgi:signal transduction histidine kinase